MTAGDNTQHDPGDVHTNGNDINVELTVQPVVADTMTQLTELWQAFGLSEEEQLQQKKILIATVTKSCQARVTTWRNEVDRATVRVSELEREVQTIKALFQGNDVRLERVAV